MSDIYLDTIFKQSQILRNTESYLKHLAHCFMVTGNTHLSNNLYQASVDIQKATQGINDAVTLEITCRLDESQRSADNMVKAALAGIAITKE